MSNHNNFLALAEVCRNVSRRFVPPDDGRVWFINTGDVLDGSFLHEEVSDWSDLPGQAKKSIRKGDVLYSEIRPGNGRFAHVLEDFTTAVVSTKFMVLEAKSNIQPRYLYHVLTSKLIQNEFKLIAESRSGTFPQITFDSVAHVDFYVPNLNEQRNIVNFLDTIENLVKVKNQENQTLEEIAKAIFKSWFVDFDPVRAKAQGRPTGLPPEISDLFPDELVESEIGEIPSGWDVGSISDFGQVVCGKTPSTKSPLNFDGVYPFITIPDMRNGLVNIETGRTISDEGARSLRGKLLPPGSICVSCIATSGLVTMTTKESFTNQQINSIIPGNEDSREYLLFSMIKMGKLIGSEGSGGSVFTNLNTGRFKRLPILVPQVEVLSAYSDVCKAILDRMMLTCMEIKTLSELRDTLLPKLISGELRIPDAEKFLEEAGV